MSPEARTSGGYWHHQRRVDPARSLHDQRFQGQLLQELASFTGTPLSAALAFAQEGAAVAAADLSEAANAETVRMIEDLGRPSSGPPL